MFGENRYPPSPFDYPSGDDYYEAVNEYHRWLKSREEAEAEAADQAYDDRIDFEQQ